MKILFMNILTIGDRYHELNASEHHILIIVSSCHKHFVS